MIKQITTLCAACLLAFSACVPARLLDESKAKLSTCETELASIKQSAQENDTQLKELKEQNEKFQTMLTALRRDTSVNGTTYRNLVSKYDKINVLNEKLQERLAKLVSGEASDNARLSDNLQSTQEQLLKKQDELQALGEQLQRQKAGLDLLRSELEKREARVDELESILKKKDDALADLKKKLSDALVGFENKGLTITQKNGKVYISMDESLLFASGKTNVEAKGVEALRNVAKVLEQNADINVMVEGHTDDVPMKGAGEIKDNWDLSVMRATSVTKILLTSAKIDGERITAAGRGDFFPLDKGKTAEARKKNRRTELILSPKLDELLKVLENN
ncbi:MAG: OmpA family protein [Bacteroidetes bacterium]|nr:OmpA family protein [Bacteroidota bacterium]